MFVAGGIGITVFRSMLRYIADEELPYRVTLVFSNRDRESAAFLDELEELERRIEGLRVILTMTDEEGWQGETRQLDADVLRELAMGWRTSSSSSRGRRRWPRASPARCSAPGSRRTACWRTSFRATDTLQIPGKL